MKKIIPLSIALTVAGVCCVVSAYFCHFYYHLYRNTETELEGRINGFDARLTTLEAHKSRELTPVHVWGQISTTDRSADTSMLLEVPPDKNTGHFFEAIGAKGGPVIRPEFRLAADSPTNYQFTIQIDEQGFGSVVDAWLSHAEPYRDLAAFEQFKVYCDNKTNVVKLIARAKPDASIQMRFDIVVLCQH